MDISCKGGKMRGESGHRGPGGCSFGPHPLPRRLTWGVGSKQPLLFGVPEESVAPGRASLQLRQET